VKAQNIPKASDLTFRNSLPDFVIPVRTGSGGQAGLFMLFEERISRFFKFG
jgi:hypothetical protein